MSDLALDMAASLGFTDEDRRRFERVDLRVEDILKRLEEIVDRFREVEVDIDELRISKADKQELSSSLVHTHETRLQVIENGIRDMRETMLAIKRDVKDTMSDYGEDLKTLKEWNIKEKAVLGLVFAVITGAVEIASHFLFR